MEAVEAHDPPPLAIEDERIASAETEALPEPHLGWAIFAVMVSFGITAVMAVVVCFVASIFLPGLLQNYELVCVLSGALGSIVMAGMSWTCLQPFPRARLALVAPRPEHALLAITLALPALVVSGSFSTWVMGLLPGDAFAAGSFGGNGYDHWFFYRAIARQPWLVVIVVGCLMPALAEEAFFRGFLGRGLIARYGELPGVLLTSMLFGAVHLEPLHILCTFILGLFLHALFLFSHSLWPPILLHMLNNVAAFGLLKCELEGLIPASVVADLYQTSICWTAAFASAGCLWILWRTRRKWTNEDGSPLGRSFFTVEPPSLPARLDNPPGKVGEWVVCGVAGLSFAVPFANYANNQRGPIASVRILKVADAALERSDYLKASHLYSQVIELAPRDSAAWCGRSLTSMQLGDYEAALSDADMAIKLEPNYAGAIAARAYALNALQRHHEALDAAQRATELSPDDVWICTALVSAAMSARDYATAIRAAKHGRKLDKSAPYFPMILSRVYGECPYRRFRDEYQAMIMAEEACALSSYEDADALLSLSSVRWAAGDYDAAILLIEQAAALGSSASSRYAALRARDAKEASQVVAELRQWWRGVVIDNVVRYEHRRMAYIIVPVEQLALAKSQTIYLPTLAGWRCEVLTSIDYDNQLLSFWQCLKQCGASDDQAELITWSIATNAKDFLAIGDAELAKELSLDEPAIVRLKAKLQEAADRQ